VRRSRSKYFIRRFETGRGSERVEEKKYRLHNLFQRPAKPGGAEVTPDGGKESGRETGRGGGGGTFLVD